MEEVVKGSSILRAESALILGGPSELSKWLRSCGGKRCYLETE